jgi:hypothetical protein
MNGGSEFFSKQETVRLSSIEHLTAWNTSPNNRKGFIAKLGDSIKLPKGEWNEILLTYNNKIKATLNPVPGYPDNNPKTAFGVKKVPLHLVPPSSIAYMAMAFADGAKKYGPYNWREKNISSSVYYAALQRHIQSWWDGEEIAEDSGEHHLAHALACIALIVDSKELGTLNDDRPAKGSMSNILKKYNKE